MVQRVVKQEQGDLFLPPGFRFHPTDEEVITSYLLQKFLNPSFSPRAMGEVNLNKCEPWDLPSKAKMGEKEWYFFSHKDMKYPTGMRTNRATKEGYWKATGKDREIFKQTSSASGGGRELVGMKKTLVFYMGRAPRGSKTNWVMHEFRLDGKSRQNTSLYHSPKDEWVVCKVFHKTNGENKKAAVDQYSAGTPNVSSISVDAAAGDDGDDFLDSMIDPMYFNSTSSLPDTMTMNATAAPPYNEVSCTSTAATNSTVGGSSFVDLPNYAFFNDSTTSRNLHQAAVANILTVPTSSSGYNSSWNLLHAGHNPMGGSYNLHHQAMMAKALGGVISPNFAAGLIPSSSVTGISQQNSLVRNYGGSYATHYPASGDAASTATVNIGQAAKNLGD
ncbi:hypothetical protein PR202_gb00683 [Eleusine coracana subsp. coracana]|uniref:NAC domain-containing protein n=1 Tax=Eleusine coracana subsp. coracana TaxID=191504 RepID=A0AAV5DU03_ELECO|nr:hypothetical protein QOZ80_5BG0426690 [Eleusine coracana subsp. coracana]GJN13925.1 hypothetical protein PR202_gb00683 [Eleusine coracana subsp. coracana]